jgi:hypothetical protein
VLALIFGTFLTLLLLFFRLVWWGFEAELLLTEVIAISASQWQVTRDYGLWKVIRRYVAANIVDVDRSPRFMSERVKQPLTVFFRRPGQVIIRFRKGRWLGREIAYSATEAEARHILDAIHHVYPQYRPTSGPAVIAIPPAPTKRAWLATHEGGAIELAVPVRRRPSTFAKLVYQFLFSVAWTGFFGYAFLHTPSGWPLFVLFGAFGGFILVWSARELYWTLRGEETAGISGSGLRLHNKHLPFSQALEFQPAYLTKLRHAPRHSDPMHSLGRWRKPGDYGLLAFDYGAATYRFGEGLTADEADEIIRLILAQFPQYGRDALAGPQAA